MKNTKKLTNVSYIIAVLLIIIGIIELPMGFASIAGAILLIIHSSKLSKNQKILIELQTANEDLQTQIAEKQALLDEPMYIKYSTDKKVREEIENEIQLNNETVSELRRNITNLKDELEKLEKKQRTAQNKLNKITEIFRSIEYAITSFYNSEDIYSVEISPESKEKIDELSPTVILNLHSMDIKDLRKAFRQNDRDIQTVLAAYVGRYTTKSNQCIYQLMVIALRSELQNILVDLRYEKLDVAVEKVKTMTAKYLAIAGSGNQNIVTTLTKFIGQIEYLFINAVKIEYNYYVKKEQSRQEQLAIREQMRLEAQERKALEEEKKKIEKEEAKFIGKIEELKAQTKTAQDSELEALNARIAELEAQLSYVIVKKDEIVKLQNGKAGNIYIISNLGSFGEDVFKIGMTRRADPQDRVNELGDASVPFKFDVHSFIFSDDAVELEKKLHSILNKKRINKVNLRKEFFRISLDELEELVLSIEPTAEFTRTIAAEEYRQSISTDEVYTSDYITNYDEDNNE